MLSIALRSLAGCKSHSVEALSKKDCSVICMKLDVQMALVDEQHGFAALQNTPVCDGQTSWEIYDLHLNLVSRKDTAELSSREIIFYGR